MKKIYLLFCLMLSLSAFILAQDLNTIELNGKTYVVEVQPRTMLNNKIIFLFDRSGSMSPGNLSEAIDFIQFVIEQNSDEAMVGIIAFNSFIRRWPGIPEPNSDPPFPAYWGRLPSQELSENVNSWLNSMGGDACTNIIPALNLAMSEPYEHLSLVIVTDGEFSESSQSIRDAYFEAQRQRGNRGLPPITIMSFGVTSFPDNDLIFFAEEGGLGFYHPIATNDDPPEIPLGPPPMPLPPLPPIDSPR